MVTRIDSSLHRKVQGPFLFTGPVIVLFSAGGLSRMQRYFPEKLFETYFIYVRRLDDEWFSYDAFSRSGIRRCLSDLRQISGKKMGR